MNIALFAIIGATIKAGTGYWICFGIYCLLRLIDFILRIAKAILDKMEEKNQWQHLTK